jgi:hypothetical protein
MPERATTFQTAQIGLESAAGTAVAAGKLLMASEVSLAIKNQAVAFRPGGQKFITTASPGKEWSTGKWSMGAVTYDEIVYWLSASHKKVTAASDTSLGKLWTIAPAYNDADTIATYTIEVGSGVRAHEAAYCIVPEFKMHWDRDKVTADGTILGYALSDGITMTSTPSALPVVPVLPTQVSLYLADTMAGLAGATAIDRGFAVDYSLADRFGPVWPLKAAATNWPAHVETVPKATMKLLLAADATGMGLLTQMRAGSTKYLRVDAVGATIESGKTYQLELTAALKFTTDPDEFTDHEGVYAIAWNAEVAYDATATYAMQWKVRNTTAAL